VRQHDSRLLILAAGLAISSVTGLAQTASKVAAHWQGKILIPDRELAITVDLDQNKKGAWIGSLTVAGSSSVDVPLNSVAVDGSAVKFTVGLPGPTNFEGKLSADGAALTGTASSAAGEASFQLTRAGDANVKLPPPSSPLPPALSGGWEGSLDAGGRVRRVGLKFTAAADGAANATLIAIDQGNLEIPVATVTIKGKDVQLEVRAISGGYRGALNDAGEIAGEWEQGGSKFPLTFKKK